MRKKSVLFLLLSVLVLAFTVGCNEKEAENSGANTGEATTQASTASGDTEAQDAPVKFTERDMQLTPDITEAIRVKLSDNNSYTITNEGVYIVSGEAKDFTVIVDCGKEGKVQLVIDNASITNTNAPVIYVKSADKCFVSPLGENTLSVTGEYVPDEDTNTDAVIYSKKKLVLNGKGTINIHSPYGNGVSVKDSLKVTGGTYNIESGKHAVEVKDSIAICGGAFDIKSGKDGFHCKNSDDDSLGWIYISGGDFKVSAASDGIQGTSYMTIDGGTFTIDAEEGIEATAIEVNGGDITINATDDGINATNKSTQYEPSFVMNGGNVDITMGPGDTDGIDVNGSITVNGGTISINGVSTFDYDKEAIYNGGTIIINGEEVDGIPESQQFGPGGNKGDFGGRGDGNFEGRPEDGERPDVDFGDMPDGKRPGGPKGDMQGGKF